MTEAEWLACTDPHRLIFGIGGRLTRRQHCLIAAALARRAARLVPAEQINPALRRLESADAPLGVPTEHGADVYAITAVGRMLAEAATRLTGVDYTAHCTEGPSLPTAVSDVALLARVANAAARAGSGRTVKMLRIRERQSQRRVIQEIAGNPFRGASVRPAWRTSTVLLLARQIYESGDFSALPILADALQDAGCDDEDILNHCRDTSVPHVRGCWVADLVLGEK